MPGITETDKQDILFGIEQNIDIIALSFVRNAETIREVRDLLGDSASLSAKIALERLNDLAFKMLMEEGLSKDDELDADQKALEML